MTCGSISSMPILRDHYLCRATKSVAMAMHSVAERVGNAVSGFVSGDITAASIESVRHDIADMQTLANALYNMRCAAAAADLADKPSHYTGDDGS